MSRRTRLFAQADGWNRGRRQERPCPLRHRRRDTRRGLLFASVARSRPPARRRLRANPRTARRAWIYICGDGGELTITRTTL